MNKVRTIDNADRYSGINYIFSDQKINNCLSWTDKQCSLRSLVKDLHSLSEIKADSEMSLGYYIDHHVSSRLTRSEKPFKHIEYDGFIVFKKGQELFYKGNYGNVIKVYYDLDTDTLSCDTNFIGKVINDPNIKELAMMSKNHTHLFCTERIIKYQSTIENLKHKYNDECHSCKKKHHLFGF